MSFFICRKITHLFVITTTKPFHSNVHIFFFFGQLKMWNVCNDKQAVTYKIKLSLASVTRGKKKQVSETTKKDLLEKITDLVNYYIWHGCNWFSSQVVAFRHFVMHLLASQGNIQRLVPCTSDTQLLAWINLGTNHRWQTYLVLGSRNDGDAWFRTAHEPWSPGWKFWVIPSTRLWPPLLLELSCFGEYIVLQHRFKSSEPEA